MFTHSQPITCEKDDWLPHHEHPADAAILSRPLCMGSEHLLLSDCFHVSQRKAGGRARNMPESPACHPISTVAQNLAVRKKAAHSRAKAFRLPWHFAAANLYSKRYSPPAEMQARCKLWTLPCDAWKDFPKAADHGSAFSGRRCNLERDLSCRRQQRLGAILGEHQELCYLIILMVISLRNAASWQA